MIGLGVDEVAVQAVPVAVSHCHACVLPRVDLLRTHPTQSRSLDMLRSCCRNGRPTRVRLRSLGWRSTAD
eukprot:3415610-Amphidinium_carterae.1